MLVLGAVMVVMGEKQKKAFRRVCDLLEEKQEIMDTLMDADERERLLEERDVLIKKYQAHIRDIRNKYNKWMYEGKCNELEFYRIAENYRKLLREEYEVRFGCIK